MSGTRATKIGFASLMEPPSPKRSKPVAKKSSNPKPKPKPKRPPQRKSPPPAEPKGTGVFPVVAVTWEDCIGVDGWAPVNVLEGELPLILTVGILVIQDEHSLVIVSGCDAHLERGIDPEVGGSMKIPLAAIKESRVLGQVEVSGTSIVYVPAKGGRRG